jgi:hypothetical protein
LASLAWFAAIYGDRIDAATALLIGYGLLMILAQLCLAARLPAAAVHAQHVGLHRQLGGRRHRGDHLAAERRAGWVSYGA